MARVFSSKEIKNFEALLMKCGDLDEFQLMESVAAEMAAVLEKFLEKYCRYFDAISVLVGPGSNGGDAISAIRKLLIASKHSGLKLPPVEIYFFDQLGELGLRQKKLWEERYGTKMSFNFSHFPERFSRQKSKKTLLIDGVFGTGLKANRRLDPDNQRTIDVILKNRLDFYIVGIDLPSGLLDNAAMLSGFEKWTVDLTLCVSGPKWSQMDGTGVRASGKLVSVPLLEEPGAEFLLQECADAKKKLVEKEIKKSEINARCATTLPKFLSSKKEIRDLLTSWKVKIIKRPVSAHKNWRPPVLVLGGNLGRGGAAKFVAESILRMGSGSVYLQETPHSTNTGRFYLSSANEWLCLNSAETFSLLKNSMFQTVVFGPGLPALENENRAQVAKEVSQALLGLRRYFRGTLVVDGGGLAFWAEDLKKHGQVPYSVILTPHPGEALDMLSVFESVKPRFAQKPKSRDTAKMEKRFSSLKHLKRQKRSEEISPENISDASVYSPLSRREIFMKLASMLSEYFINSKNANVLLLKGAYPICGTFGECAESLSNLRVSNTFIFNLANARLATQGSGDVLAGLIAGIIQRFKNSNYKNLAALCTAVMIQKKSLQTSSQHVSVKSARNIQLSPDLERSSMRAGKKLLGEPVMIARDQLRIFPVIAEKWLRQWSYL